MPKTCPLPPLRFRPVLKDYVWGGRGLEEVLGRSLPAGNIAESWEISDHPDGETIVSEGPFAGRKLSAILSDFGEELLGSRNSDSDPLRPRRFPLLVKILDANEWLSVQVHPDDSYALKHEDDLGKTEMWVVLHAQPGAEIILGFSRKMDHNRFSDHLGSATVEDALHHLPARAGDVFYVRPGLIHAIGPGLILAEIQQTSNVTYRVHDWNRGNESGAGRELHLDRALEVIDFDSLRPGPVEASPMAVPGHELLVECAHFRVERLRLENDRTVNRWRGNCVGSTFEIWGLIQGTADLVWEGGVEELEPVSWLLLPACLGEFHVKTRGTAQLLRAFIPAG